jgi:O-6-methylguanine DNA methyltransferase
VFVAATDHGVCAVYVLDSDDVASGLKRFREDFPNATYSVDPTLRQTVIQRIVDHLGEGRPIDDLPLDLRRGTPFQRRVWQALLRIPRGETMTYAGVARALGVPGAARAVGSACGANPVSLLVPCHRVVREGGALGGFGWGLERKRMLLDWEQSTAQPRADAT